MVKDHGLAGLFGGEEAPKRKQPAAEPVAPAGELPPVLEPAEASPLEQLTEKIVAEQPRLEALPDDAPEPDTTDTENLVVLGASEDQDALDDSYLDQAETGILCFLLEGGEDRQRRRTLAALNVAAGNDKVMLRTLPSDPDAMDEALEIALASTDCTLAAFLSPGTEPADDWAVECLAAFREAPRTAAMSVRAANSDPLSPWARVSFFMDEAERQKGIARGHDTVVFRVSALKELRENIGHAVRTGNILPAVRQMGHRVGVASEARVTLASPAARADVLVHVKEQARLAARRQAAGKSLPVRLIKSLGVLMSFPFRVLEVRAAGKRSIGGTQFREVAPKAAMAIMADRWVRAMTLLRPGTSDER